MIKLTTSYALATDVSSFLNVSAWGAGTTPTSTHVDNMINEKEDEFDQATNHAWRLRYSGTQSFSDTTAKYEYYDLNTSFYKYSLGFPLHLQHRLIRSLTSGTDLIEVWDGNDWTDWIASASRTEGRNNDYFLEQEKGVLYLRNWSRYPRGVRIKYRYGDTTVPGDVKDAIVKMVAIEIVATDDRSVQLPEGTSQLPYSGKIDRWQKDIDRIIARRSELIYATL